MKYTVTIEIEIDPTEYMFAEDSPTGAIDVVRQMIQGRADYPDEGRANLRCQKTTEMVSFDSLNNHRGQ